MPPVPAAVKVLAHRGALLNAPENTLSAFRAAFAAGAAGVECDVRRTRDGEFVLFHDAELARTTGAAGKVETSAFRDLASLRVFGKEPIAHLDDFLDLLAGHPGKSCHFEMVLRGERDAADLALKIAEARLRNDLQLLSFTNKASLLRAARAAVPEIGISVMPLTPVRLLETARSVGARSICTGWNQWPISRLWFRFIAAATDLRGSVRRAADAGVLVTGGVANAPGEVRWFRDLGMGAVWTDDVPMALEALA